MVYLSFSLSVICLNLKCLNLTAKQNSSSKHKRWLSSLRKFGLPVRKPVICVLSRLEKNYIACIKQEKAGSEFFRMVYNFLNDTFALNIWEQLIN